MVMKCVLVNRVIATEQLIYFEVGEEQFHLAENQPWPSSVLSTKIRLYTFRKLASKINKKNMVTHPYGKDHTSCSRIVPNECGASARDTISISQNTGH
jgi:hypothetical protein